MKYTEAQRKHIEQNYTPHLCDIIEKSFENFIGWYNDDNISDTHKQILADSLMLTMTPSVIYPQYIRLEIIEMWKDKFEDYQFITDKITNIR